MKERLGASAWCVLRTGLIAQGGESEKSGRMGSIGSWRAVVKRFAFVVILIGVVAPFGAGGAQGYYNLDAGRPGRVEDASPTERYELDLQLLPVRFERFASGTTRWRSDPKLSFGIAPFTEIELRVPLLMIASSTRGQSTAGVGGIAIGGLHALTLETGALPAFALSGEWMAPVGGMSAHVGSYSAKLIGTKTLEHLRVHVNVGYGTWSVRPPNASAVSCPGVVLPGTVVPPGCGPAPPVIPDTPCDRVDEGARFACVGTASLFEESSTASVAVTGTPSVGYRWMSGLAVDRAFPLASTLVMADVVAERFIGLYDATDWTAELGLRHQWTPTLVVDLGVARHFAGPVKSNAVTAGITYGAPRQMRRAHGGTP